MLAQLFAKRNVRARPSLITLNELIRKVRRSSNQLECVENELTRSTLSIEDVAREKEKAIEKLANAMMPKSFSSVDELVDIGELEAKMVEAEEKERKLNESLDLTTAKYVELEPNFEKFRVRVINLEKLIGNYVDQIRIDELTQRKIGKGGKVGGWPVVFGYSVSVSSKNPMRATITVSTNPDYDDEEDEFTVMGSVGAIAHVIGFCEQKK
jgi:hypothetical protein